MTRYRWIEPSPPDERAYGLVDHALLCAILSTRGVGTPEEAETFLSPSLSHLADPFLLPEMDLAVARIRGAVAGGALIAVFGDYDVDGLTSTAMLVRAIRALGGRAEAYVPNRLRDGYGLNAGAIEQIIRDGAALLVALDCGTGNGAELAAARSRGVETVVVDHHAVHGQELPGTAFVSPRRPGSRYPFPDHCAAGLTFTLLRALLGTDEAARFLPLAALGTVADVVPLVGENRVIVAQGLARFAVDAPVGLQALAEDAGLEPRRVGSWDLGYILGPRINAAGRMDDPALALDLLLTDDPGEARRLARVLSRLNALRQQATERMLAEAEAKLAADGRIDAPLLIVSDAGWSAGLVGLLAGRLAERYHRPALVFADDGALSRGSARSIEGFDIVGALTECQDLLLEHGGHAKAAGLTLETAKLLSLEERLLELLARTFAGGLPEPALAIDAELHPCELSLETEEMVGLLEPFGHGNPTPRFLVRNLAVDRLGTSRDGKHLLFRVRGAGCPPVRAIAFHAGPRLAELRRSARVDLVCSLRRDHWNGRTSLKLDVVDFRPSR